MSTPLRILVVDDLPDVADMVASVLSLMGHQCTVAYNGKQAQTVASQFAPQVCIIDYGMPDMTGPELVRELRKAPACREALMIVHTAYGDAIHREVARDAGFDAYVVKPVGAAEWARTVSIQRPVGDTSQLVTT